MRTINGHIARTPWRSVAHDRSMYSEDGFTLIESIIVVAVVPLVIGAISLALISVLSLQAGVRRASPPRPMRKWSRPTFRRMSKVRT